MNKLPPTTATEKPAGDRQGFFSRQFNRWFSHWLSRRLPPQNHWCLSRKNLFVFPTRSGFFYLGLIPLCWLVATNFKNNIIFGVSCLLAAVFVVTILHSFANLAGLQLSLAKEATGFCGENVALELMLSDSQQQYRDALQLSFSGATPVVTYLDAGRQQRVEVPFVTRQRGWVNPGRLRVESTFPFGLLRVWTYLDFATHILVYPKPISDSVHTQLQQPSDTGLSSDQAGQDDFADLVTYKVGDSFKHLSWKHYAREQGLLTKQFSQQVDQQYWLDWYSFDGIDPEGRLSRLCHQAVIAHTHHQCFGLKLPNQTIAPSDGEAHYLAVLRALALFQVADLKSGSDVEKGDGFG